MRNQSQSDHRQIFYLTVSLVIALASTAAWLCWVLDFDMVQALVKEPWLQSVMHATNAVIGAIVLRLLQTRSLQKNLYSPLKTLVVVSALGLLISLVASYRLQAHVDSLLVLSINFVAPFLISSLLSIVYFIVAYIIRHDDDTDYQGYRELLVIGFSGAAIFSLLFFFDTPLVIFLVFTKVIILLALAASCYGLRVFNITGKKYAFRSIVLLALCVPLVVYAKVPLQIGWYITTATTSALVKALTNDESYSVSTISTGPGKFDSPVLKSTFVFNDSWILDNQERLAVTADKLMRSIDGGITWSKEKDLAFYGNAIQFDHTGQRGWVGNRYYGMEITEDGGQSWRTLSPESAYKQAQGVKYEEGIFSTISELHLDPETGSGSFTAKCSHYSTEDFAKSWTRQDFVFNDGKKGCLLDTAFSIDSTGNLALIKGLLSEELYRHTATEGVWEPVCDLDGSEIGTNYCSEDDSLDETEKLFSAHYWNEDYFYGGTRPYGETRENILRYGSQPIASMSKPPRKAGSTYWFADEGYLATSSDEGSSWTIEQDVRRFTNVLPVSLTQGFAWNPGEALWVSRNSGSTWQRFFDDEVSLPLDIEVTHNGEYLWLLYPEKLLKLDSRLEEITIVQSWSQPYYTQLGSADNGAVMWAFRYDGELSTVSFDSGNIWHNFQASKAQRTRSRGWTSASVTAMSCASGTLTCFLMRSDNTLSEVTLAQGVFNLSGPEKIELPDNEDDEYYAGYEHLVVSDSGDTLVIIPDAGRFSYVSNDRGLNWTKTSLGTTSDYWYTLSVSGDGASLAIKNDEGLSISNDFGNSWSVVKPDIDYGAESWNYCWSQDAQTLFLYDEDYLAMSTNGGSSWNEFDDTHLAEPWCGIGNGLLWLKTENIDISSVSND